MKATAIEEETATKADWQGLLNDIERGQDEPTWLDEGKVTLPETALGHRLFKDARALAESLAEGGGASEDLVSWIGARKAINSACRIVLESCTNEDDRLHFKVRAVSGRDNPIYESTMPYFEALRLVTGFEEQSSSAAYAVEVLTDSLDYTGFPH